VHLYSSFTNHYDDALNAVIRCRNSKGFDAFLRVRTISLSTEHMLTIALHRDVTNILNVAAFTLSHS